MQTLALAGHAARRWEHKKLRHRLFRIAGRLAITGRRRWLHLAATAPFTELLLQGLQLDQLRLQPLAVPG